MPGKLGWRAPLYERFFRYVDLTPVPPHGCLLWIGKRAWNGYGRFWYEGKNHNAHRVAAILHFGEEAMRGKLARHYVCDNPPCVNWEHLLPGTHKDNHADAMVRGRHSSQKAAWAANRIRKLEDHEVLEIFNSEEPNNVLAQRFSVSPSTIADIQHGITYVWLTKAEKRRIRRIWTSDDIRDIRSSSSTTIALGKEYGVDPSVISRIKCGLAHADLLEGMIKL